MTDQKRSILIICTSVLCCAFMAVIDGVIKADYFVKSLIKLVVFIFIPFLLFIFEKKLLLKSLFNFNCKKLKNIPILCVALYTLIICAYFLFKDFFDFSNITKSLSNNIGVSGQNFIYVSLYISFVNSMLEEFFFRGFVFMNLKKTLNRKWAYIFSALIFAIYHIAMMTDWFSIWVMIISLVGLFIGGLIFNFLNEESESIYPSWFVHMFANFAINTIGFILFGAL